MSGIYIHIPFCKKACHYCNFHFSTNLNLQSAVIASIVKEIEIQRHYLNNDKIQTIYFGGGTPSVLNKAEIEGILSAIYKFHDVIDDVEITLEANPDDLTASKLKDLHQAGINRLSIGVQSFEDKDLDWMNRSHNVEQAYNSIKFAQDIGISNISIDLIFGCPTNSDEIWYKNLSQTNDLNVPHISCYGLTVEPNTALEKMIKLGKKEAPDEGRYADQFSSTVKVLNEFGYDHYEISNYAKDEKYSKHNTHYWLQKKYLGVGPAAHSFNGKERQWNVSHNSKYIAQIDNGQVPFEKELLKPKDIFNEYLLTGLRTKWGCHKSNLAFLGDDHKQQFLYTVDSLIHSGDIIENANHYVLSSQGKLMADNIIATLFYDHN
ncbi:MAG: radical SAM family heme chaperone HemW [Bacteroidia bacterium]|nr:radical SAM family heme chaperone HemW [Bacteroidia bacterium]